jgi:hypothetical protein
MILSFRRPVQQSSPGGEAEPGLQDAVRRLPGRDAANAAPAPPCAARALGVSALFPRCVAPRGTSSTLASLRLRAAYARPARWGCPHGGDRIRALGVSAGDFRTRALGVSAFRAYPLGCPICRYHSEVPPTSAR